jgi:hypothetical protein
MPTAVELERLQALVSRLTPLTDVGPGELIRAQDWNVVVGALIEVARAVLTDAAEDGEPPPHEHADQVSIGWLSPALRDLVERGPLADPAAEKRIEDLTRKVDRLGNRADTQATDLTAVRDAVAEVSTRGLAREADVTQVRRVVEGMNDARDDVTALRRTLRTIEDDVKVAVEVGSGLTIGGQPVDMEAVGGRIAALEELRERLRTPSGALLDASALEVRLTELTTTLVTEAELDEALRSRPGVITDAQVAGLEEGLRASLGAQVDSSVRAGTDALRAEVDQRFAVIDGQIATRITEATPGISESVLAAGRTQLDERLAGFGDEVSALVGERIAAADATLRGVIDTRAAELQAAFPEAVKAGLAEQLPATIDPLRAQVDGLTVRADAADALAQQHAGSLAALAGDLNAVRASQGEAVQGLRAEIDTRLAQERVITDGRFADLEGNLDGRVAIAIEGLGPQLDARVASAVAEATAGLDATVRSIVADEAGAVEGRVAARTEELLAARIDALREETDAKLKEAVTVMPRRVFDEMGSDLQVFVDRRIDTRIG